MALQLKLENIKMKQDLDDLNDSHPKRTNHKDEPEEDEDYEEEYS
jgi:hypothetical protein